MNKQEFLSILNMSLSGEISTANVEDHINYYNHYINSNKPGREEETIQELGDPRLIAKTIIETERLSKTKNKFGEDFSRNRSYHNEYHEEYEKDYKQEQPGQSKGSIKSIFWSNLSLVQKITAIGSIALVLIILFFIAKVLFKMVAVFGFPILVIYILYRLFRKR